MASKNSNNKAYHNSQLSILNKKNSQLSIKNYKLQNLLSKKLD